MTDTKTNTKCFKDSMYAIFWGFKHFKDYIGITFCDFKDAKKHNKNVLQTPNVCYILLKAVGSKISNFTFPPTNFH